MRRALFGGIGLALGFFASPATGQDYRTAPPPARAARLGAPTAVPDPVAAPDSGIEPVGLRTRLFGTPTPIYSASAPGVIVPGTTVLPGTVVPGSIVPGVQPTPMPMATVPQVPAPRPIQGGTPSVTEMRNSDGTLVYPPGIAGNPYLVPTVIPGTTVVGPGLETPIYGEMPGMGAMNRVQNSDPWWFGAEYLAWWSKSADLPLLITTSAPQFNGIPGLGNTTAVLQGNFGDTFQSGARFTLGRWFGPCQTRGIEGRFFFLNESNSTFTASSDQFPVLARPFINVNTPVGPFSEVVADPARGVGAVVVNRTSSVWGAEANYRRFLCGNPCARVDAIVGFRYFGLKEQLSVGEQFNSFGTGGTTVGGVPVISGSVTDVFRTENQFYGGQIGLVGELHRGRWTLEGRATVAFGNVQQTAEINGTQSLILANGMRTNFQGGLLALPGANIGRYTQNQFAVIPEVGLNLGYQVTQRLRVFVGYNFLYLGNALRPEGLIDPNIDAARIPNFPLQGGGAPLGGIPRPTPQFNLSDYFVQGISFGVQFRW